MRYFVLIFLVIAAAQKIQHGHQGQLSLQITSTSYLQYGSMLEYSATVHLIYNYIYMHELIFHANHSSYK